MRVCLIGGVWCVAVVMKYFFRRPNSPSGCPSVPRLSEFSHHTHNPHTDRFLFLLPIAWVSPPVSAQHAKIKQDHQHKQDDVENREEVTTIRYAPARPANTHLPHSRATTKGKNSSCSDWSSSSVC